jgi:hypothetical protein
MVRSGEASRGAISPGGHHPPVTIVVTVNPDFLLRSLGLILASPPRHGHMHHRTILSSLHLGYKLGTNLFDVFITSFFRGDGDIGGFGGPVGYR